MRSCSSIPPLTLKMARCYLAPRLVLARKTLRGQGSFLIHHPFDEKKTISSKHGFWGSMSNFFLVGFIGVFGMFFFCHPKIVTQDLRQYPRVLCSRPSLWDRCDFFPSRYVGDLGGLNCQEHHAANLAVQPNQHRCIAFENPGLTSF